LTPFDLHQITIARIETAACFDVSMPYLMQWCSDWE
jgi:hypothetical protein